MKTLLLSIFLFISVYVNASYIITIYGSNNCGYTLDLKNKLSQENIPFTYCDVNESSCYFEFFSFVKDNRLDTNNYVNLPVVKIIVNGVSYGLVRPLLSIIKMMVGITYVQLLSMPVDDVMSIIGARTIEVFNTSGIRMLYVHKNEINIHSLSSGMYILRINKRTTYKFVKY
jgi:glutaredoxin-related protein